jgi:hypothetical protein
VLRFDLCDFFPSTRAERVRQYFRRIGWNRPAAKLLARLCTHEGGLPQGAPTSPRLSNLVNYRLDARLAGMAAKLGGVYTRYADDITISFPDEGPAGGRSMEHVGRDIHTGRRAPSAKLERNADTIRYVTSFVRKVVEEEGYRLHRRKKLSVRRRHHRQVVTGLVVNDGVNLPRSTRRWLRAVAHRARLARQTPSGAVDSPSGTARKKPTLTSAQLEGWSALESMIARQRQDDR